MNYTASQIENAKKAYAEYINLRSVESYEPKYIGMNEAERRCEFHNNQVSQILAGNTELANQWKLFFLNEEVKADKKREDSKAKKQANKSASEDILAPIKELKKLVDFGKWLNQSNNKFRKEHFSKKYTQESVNEFLKTL